MGRSANVHLLMALQRAASVLMEQLGILMIRIGMKNLSVENFKMVFGVSKDESILEREKGQVIFLSMAKMEQYESRKFLPGDD